MKKLDTFGSRRTVNIKSNKTAKNEGRFFQVNQMCHFIWPGKTNKMKIRFLKSQEVKEWQSATV